MDHRVLGVAETFPGHVQGKNDWKNDHKMVFASVTALTFIIAVQKSMLLKGLASSQWQKIELVASVPCSLPLLETLTNVI